MNTSSSPAIVKRFTGKMRGAAMLKTAANITLLGVVKNTIIRALIWASLTLSTLAIAAAETAPAESSRHRVIISTDIGGTDPDDLQSMVHLLLYADSLDIEGLISSPFGPGRKRDILSIIDLYEQDYPNLARHSNTYPSATVLRSITKQGEIHSAPYRGYRRATEGSRWIVSRAKIDDPRPLHLLVWGGLEDLAQALHDAPEILPKLRVYYIGGPNKKWGPDAYYYIASQYPRLWIIESNATYRGWFEGGHQQGEWGNKGFVSKHIAGQGALGSYFANILGGRIKMGDTPSVAWLFSDNPSQPSEPSWGGQYVHAWGRPYKKFNALTTKKDSIEEFGIFELALALPSPQEGENKKTLIPEDPVAYMHVENQKLRGFIKDKRMHFRFSPKAARIFSYTIKSNIASLNALHGELTALPTSPEASLHRDPLRPNWWTDNPAPEFSEGPHIGAKTVNRWRRDYLADFALRVKRTQTQAHKLSNQP